MLKEQTTDAGNVAALALMHRIVKGTVAKLGLAIEDEKRQDTQIFNRIVLACNDKK